ncbi:hypothetical protein ACFQFC_04775 [Amorphoplanes digitatis]|uniref:Uncharacterized protein n=1 Tax=Actinoplanes digitatis TaxID=1868 RepID=A0A7W7HZ70_9ACTN|nr:hypothetical protein [Actinoplanes digitatis]MBB4763502.1 hypothetical protein [Actinoplanes digitatis]GID93241.1 hypothetical protein Adi01nite_26530 [Actinoplanes digitatis]
MVKVVHQPRVAWDAALAFVRAAAGPNSADFGARLESRLGAELHDQFVVTRQRLLLARGGGDRHTADVEAGRWRVLLEDLLRVRPDLTGAVVELTGGGPGV